MRSPLVQLLFPQPARRFRGERWVNVVLRSLHLVGVAGIGGGFLFDQPPAAWEAYWHLTVGSGVALSALYLWGTAAWLFELKGLSILVKTLLVAVALWLPALRAELFIAVVILSGLIAHAPAWVRGYRWFGPPAPAPDRRAASDGRARRSGRPRQGKTRQRR